MDSVEELGDVRVMVGVMVREVREKEREFGLQIWLDKV